MVGQATILHLSKFDIDINLTDNDGLVITKI